MSSSLLSAFMLITAVVGADQQKSPVRPFESRGELAPRGKIDELVFGKLKQLGIPPANPCSDEVFVRRVYLDVIGTLPTPKEVRQFLRDEDPNKRSVLIDHLLQRKEFADYWAMKWSDLLRVKAEFPINLWPNAAQAYHRWIRTAVKENMPYDRFARELLTANGSNFRVPQVNFYRAMQSREPQAIAQAVALAFMGTRTEKWPKERLDGLGAFFVRLNYKATEEWKEEIVFFDPNQKVTPASDGVTPQPVFPDGTPARLAPDQDPRVALADWLLQPQNPWFNRNMANRAWAWLFGRGIIHEPDDIRQDNPPSNPELLAYLEQELVASHYDLKHLFRLILNSQTYQLSSIRQSKDPRADANFASYPVRRLEAEVLIDALNQITGTTEKYTSAIPEPFTFIPEEQRAISLADGSISSSFLEMFGRSSRDTGLESERNNRPTADQRLHLLNSSHVQRKIEQSQKLFAMAQGSTRPRDVADGLYLTILSRFPSDDELKSIAAYSQPRKSKGREVLVDLAWALINSVEFQYRH